MTIFDANCVSGCAEAALGIDIVHFKGDAIVNSIAFRAVEDCDVAGADPANAG